MPEKINEKLSINAEEGKILSDLVAKNKPLVVLEIGTGHGYSTHCISKALSDESVMYTLDIDPKYIPYEIFNNVIFSNQMVDSFVKNYSIANKIDFVFMDSDHVVDSIVNELEKLEPILSKKVTVAIHDINYREELGKCLSDYFNGIDSDNLLNVGIKPSKDKWIYENHDTEFGIGVAKRGDK